MLSFRSKLFISYILLFLCLIVVVFPYIKQSADRLVKKTLAEYADELISESKDLDSEQQLTQWLKEHQHLVFFRISLISSDGKVLYDSHSRIPAQQTKEMKKRYYDKHPELSQATKHGIGYGEGYSYLLRMKMVYVAKPFMFDDNQLIIRTAFPRTDLTDVILEFDKWFFILGVIVLLLLSVVTWFVTYHFSYPIDTIVRAIKPYKEGMSDHIPEIKMKSTEGDFIHLAETINSLSSRVQEQIESLTLERNEKQAVLESLIEGVISVNGSMVIQYANRAVSKILGRELEELIGMPFGVVEWDSCYQYLEDCQRQEEVLVSCEQRGDKKKRFFNIVAAPKMQGAGAILVLQDITEQHRMDEMRKDFIANASHELKTPITIVQGFAETLHEHPNLSQEKIIHITEKIVRNCRRMEDLIKNLLTLSNAEHLPESRLQEINILSLIEVCIQFVKSAYSDCSVTVLQDPSSGPIMLVADAHLLELAITNLLENAAKYSKDDAHVYIRVTKSSGINIEVQDQGIGIPEEDIEHIFDRFYRVDKARSRALGGCGLGLSIVRTIIEKHAGTIDVKSDLGVGTTFTILLPLHPSHREE